jgi:hypothetical protein
MIKVVQTSQSVFVATQEGKSLLWPTRSRETKESCVCHVQVERQHPLLYLCYRKKNEILQMSRSQLWQGGPGMRPIKGPFLSFLISHHGTSLHMGLK